MQSGLGIESQKDSRYFYAKERSANDDYKRRRMIGALFTILFIVRLTSSDYDSRLPPDVALGSLPYLPYSRSEPL